MPYLAAVALKDEVLAMENGPDTVIGSGGTRLSGGQAQRLALADAPYLFLFQMNVLTPMRAEVEGFIYNPMLDRMYDFEHLSKK